MPTIARFYGLIIKMYLLGKEHGRPHIHVIYGDYAGVLDIKTGEMIEGDLPPRALQMASEWTLLHSSELQEMWERQEFRELPPLE